MKMKILEKLKRKYLKFYINKHKVAYNNYNKYFIILEYEIFIK